MYIMKYFHASLPMVLRYFAKKVSSGSQTVSKGSFARNVATNFKLRARMGCVIIYYVTCTQIAYLLGKSPVRESVCEPVHKPFHVPRVNSSFIRFNALPTYDLHTYVHASVAKRMSHKLTHET